MRTKLYIQSATICNLTIKPLSWVIELYSSVTKLYSWVIKPYSSVIELYSWSIKPYSCDTKKENLDIKKCSWASGFLESDYKNITSFRDQYKLFKTI